MSLNINLFTPGQLGGLSAHVLSPIPPGSVACPGCGGYVTPAKAQNGWQDCPYCEKRLQVRVWPAIQQSSNAVVAMQDHATCFFHPDRVFQACCQRCGRFLCALCDLQLGSEHVCPTCFDRGRNDSGLNKGKAEWRHRDVLYDSIVLALGWLWFIIWPLFFVALPAAIVLHVKYRKAPRSYLIPRSGWRFWVAYAGFAWLPLLIAGLILIPRLMVGRH